MKAARVTAVLRHNTTMPGDAELARREWATIMGSAGKALTGAALADQFKQQHGHTPHLATAFNWVAVTWSNVPIDKAAELVRRSAFSQEVFIEGNEVVALLATLSAQVGAPAAEAVGFCKPTIVCLTHNYVIESEAALSASIFERRLATVISALLAPYQGDLESAQARRLRSAKKTTLSLSHDLHIYKAKFFPRMVRALINIYGPNAPIFDPYCGSGTALLEAALLGQDAIGLDIDPICKMISSSKVTPFVGQRRSVEKSLKAFRAVVLGPSHGSEFRFPDELHKKLERRDRIDGTAYLPEIVTQASALAAAVNIAADEGIAADLIRTLASDAVTKKIRYRFIGVGNGRYTIELVKQPLLDRLLEKIDRAVQLLDVFAELESELKIKLGNITVGQGDARDSGTWPRVPTSSFVVTSPPYLPASSGREHYASSRALAFAVLGFKAGEDGYFDGQVSANELPSFDQGGEADRLLRYLLSDASDNADPQRDAMRFERKAIPTALYLGDVRQFGINLSKVAKLSKLALVVADQHTFYSHRRSEVEHVVDCAALYSQILDTTTLKFTEEIELQLMKSAASRARPRAKDDYHESVLLFTPTAIAKSDAPKVVKQQRQAATAVAA